VDENTALENTSEKHKQTISAKVGKLRTAFLYVLIGGLIVSALISVIAILIGEFNDVVVKALVTTFIFVTHCLLLLAIILAYKNDRLGKSLVSTTIFITLILNMFSTTLGTWELWASDMSWKMFLIYMLVIGTSFLISGALLLRRVHKPTQLSIYVAVGFILLLTVLLAPWILFPDADWLTGLYLRSIGAVTILTATSLSLAVIFNRIAASRKLAPMNSLSVEHMAPGILAFNISIGVITAMFWMYGLVVLISQAAVVDRPTAQPYSRYYSN
jgi:hypothetical protein